MPSPSTATCAAQGNADLVQDLARRRQRLDEDSALHGQIVGQRVQVAFRQSQKFAERAGMIHDAEDATLRAMPAEPAAAPLASAARQVDLAHHAAADPRGRIRLHHFTHEFMSWSAGKTVVPALQFQIGIADAAAEQPDQCEAGGTAGLRFFPHFHTPVLQVYGNHAG